MIEKPRAEVKDPPATSASLETAKECEQPIRASELDPSLSQLKLERGREQMKARRAESAVVLKNLVSSTASNAKPQEVGAATRFSAVLARIRQKDATSDSSGSTTSAAGHLGAGGVIMPDDASDLF